MRDEHDGSAGAGAIVGPGPGRVCINWVSVQSDLFPGGRRFFATFEQLDRLSRHDGRNGMLVHELGMTIPAQQHTEIIEPSDDPLQLNSIDEKDRQWNFGLSNMVEKCILQILGAVGCHCGCSVSCSQPHSTSLLPSRSCTSFSRFRSTRTWGPPLQGTWTSHASGSSIPTSLPRDSPVYNTGGPVN